MAGTIAELLHEMTERRKVFRDVDETAIQIGLGETLKYLINSPPVEFTITKERAKELRQMYNQVSKLAQIFRVDTRSYDAAFSRQLEENTRK